MISWLVFKLVFKNYVLGTEVILSRKIELRIFDLIHHHEKRHHKTKFSRQNFRVNT